MPADVALAAPDVGTLIRLWRTRRRLSQLDLGHRADVSPKHVSFIETGRSRPTRDMLLHLCQHLDVPLRERNQLLLAGGFAPAYPEHALSDVPMAAVSSAIRQILDVQEPNPTVVVDRHWTMIDANATVGLLVEGCAAHLLDPPVNVLRLTLHPDGMSSRIINLAQWRHHLLDRLAHQIAATGDPVLGELLEELESYGGGGGGGSTNDLVVPIRIRAAAGELAFLSTTTVFGAPHDVTVADLAIETFYPMDEATSEALRAAK